MEDKKIRVCLFMMKFDKDIVNRHENKKYIFEQENFYCDGDALIEMIEKSPTDYLMLTYGDKCLPYDIYNPTDLSIPPVKVTHFTPRF